MKILLLAALRGNLSAANSWKFDFDAKKSEPGYIAITSDSVYRAQAGYGFVDASAVEDVDRRAPNPLLGNFCTSASPMSFNVDLPEGNYNVTAHLGDQTGESDTRRLRRNRDSSRSKKWSRSRGNSRRALSR